MEFQKGETKEGKNIEDLAIQERFLLDLKIGRIDEAIKIKKELDLSDEFFFGHEVQKSIQERFLLDLKIGRIDEAIKIKKELDLSDEFVFGHEVQKFFVYCLKNEQIDYALKVLGKIDFPKIFFDNKELEEVAKDIFFVNLKNGRINYAQKIKQKFNISEKEILEIFDKDKDIVCFLNSIKNNVPEAYAFFSSSFDELLSLFEFFEEPEALIEILKIKKDFFVKK